LEFGDFLENGTKPEKIKKTLNCFSFLKLFMKQWLLLRRNFSDKILKIKAGLILYCTETNKLNE